MSVESTSVIFGDKNNIIISKFEVTQEKNNLENENIKNEDKTIFILDSNIKDKVCFDLSDNICIIDEFSGEKKNFRKTFKSNTDNKEFKLGFTNILNSIEENCEFIIPIYSNIIPGNYCFDGIESHLDNYIINNDKLKIKFMLNNEAIEHIGKCYTGFDYDFNNFNKITYQEIGINFLKSYSEKNNITIILSELTINDYIRSISNKKRKFEETKFDTLHISCSGEKVKTFVLNTQKFVCNRIGGENSDVFPTYVKLSSEVNTKDIDIKSTVIILFILDSNNLNDVKIKCQYNGDCSSISYDDIEKYNRKKCILKDFYNQDNLDFSDFNTLVNLSKKNLNMVDFHNLDDKLLRKISYENDFFNYVRNNMTSCFISLLNNKDNNKNNKNNRNPMQRDATIPIPHMEYNASAIHKLGHNASVF